MIYLAHRKSKLKFLTENYVTLNRGLNICLYLDIPVSIQIVNGGDASSVPIRIVHVFHVM